MGLIGQVVDHTHTDLSKSSNRAEIHYASSNIFIHLHDKVKSENFSTGGPYWVIHTDFQKWSYLLEI